MLQRADGTFGDFAPQVLAERSPQITNSYFYANSGVQMLGHWQEYAALYRTQPVVSTLVDKIAGSAARLPLKVWDTSADQGRTEDDDSDYAKLLASPSRTLSPFNFYRWTFSTYEVMGEAYWLKVRDKDGKVVALEPMHPERVAIKRDKDGTVNYIFSIGVANAGILTVPAEDVVAFQRYNPDNTMRGLSRLEQLRVTLLNEDAARRASTAFWKNGARPSVVITHPDELSQNAIDRIKSQFDARHAGVDNVGGSVVLEEGMTVTPVQLDNDEMEYIESRKLNMQEACMVFDVPPPVVHILDHATYSNITEQMRSMYRDTMAPRFEDFESVIDFSLRVEFYPDGGREARFDMTDVLRGDWETRSQWAAALRQGGVVSGNEARDIIGLEKSDDPMMDKVFANTALQPLGEKPGPAASADGSPTGLGGDAHVPGDELLGHKPAPKPGTVPGDELLAKVKPKVGMSPQAKAAQRAILGQAGRALKAGQTPEHLKQMLVDQHIRALEPYFESQRQEVLRLDPKVLPPARKGWGLKDLGDVSNDADAPLDNSSDDGFLGDQVDDGSDTATEDLDASLQDLLASLSHSTAVAIGRMVSADLGSSDPYDASDIADLLTVEAGHSARRINAATMQQIADELAANLQDIDDDTDNDNNFDTTASPANYRQAVDRAFDKLKDERVATMAESRVSQTSLTAGIAAALAAGVAMKTWVVNSGHPRAAHAMVDGESVGLGQFFSNGMLGPGDIANGGIDEVAGCNCTLDYTNDLTETAYTPDTALEAEDVPDSEKGLKYSPDQPREHGRFAEGGGSPSTPGSAALSALGVASPGVAPETESGVAQAINGMKDTEAGITPAVQAALANTWVYSGDPAAGQAHAGTEILGSFDPSTGAGQPNAITVDTNAANDNTMAMAGTIAHEYGHAIDYQLGGGKSAAAEHMADPAGTAWGDFGHAVRESASSGFWNQEYGARMSAYAHTPTEVFARAYAQYSGLASPSEPGQFTTHDMATIAPHITAILKGSS